MKRLCASLALLALLATAATAQTRVRPYVQAESAYLHNLGYQNPSLDASIGIRLLGSRWQTEAAAQFDSAHKYIGNGYSIEAAAAAYACPARALCVGTGFIWSEERTSLWHKAAWMPQILVRERIERLTLTAHGTPGAGSDRQNHEHSAGLTAEYSVTRHFSWMADYTLAIFQPTNQPRAAWITGESLSSGLRYYFQEKP